ncbi:MAG: RraA family protein [Pseudomonadota bacterium]
MAMLPERKKYVVNPMPTQITEDQRNGLLSLDTGTIGHFLDAGFMDPGIKQRIPGSKIAGTAVTVRIPLPDSVIAHYALKFTRPGDVLVIDRGQDQYTTNWGGATIRAAALTGLAAVLVEGSVNDVEDAVEADLPLWSRWISPVTTKYRGLGGELNVPVHCGGVAISPGDAILGDDHGVVVIPREMLDETIAGGKRWLDAERAFRERLKAEPDLCYPDVTGASEIVEAALKAQGDL